MADEVSSLIFFQDDIPRINFFNKGRILAYGRSSKGGLGICVSMTYLAEQ